MNETRRTERIAAGLERQFQSCDDKLKACLDDIHEKGKFGDWEMNAALAFVKASSQVAGVIARLEALTARDTARATPPASENRGSNPQ